MSNQWRLHYRDISGRKRELKVVSEPSSVTLLLPTGDRATFTPLEIGRLRAALRDAAAEATAAAEAIVWQPNRKS
ncbi:hypothetical protein [Sciscionella sediminilitoris]|uniref:hypothetical protein n=1 Tax=Sciscionella sediminilitoris TaxID=1445613 RepID=UPI0004DF9719|nr:hypothetical protein [Sciscionella sp. SE31]